jgi:hypothetical protein
MSQKPALRLSKTFFGLRLHEQQKDVRAQLAYSIFQVGNEGFDIRHTERIIELEAQ